MSDETPLPIDPNADYLEVCKRLSDEKKKTELNDEESDDQGLPLAS